MIQALIFDMDGVVADTSIIDFTADKAVFKSVGIEMTEHRYHKRTGQTSKQRYIEELQEEGITADVEAMQMLRNEEIRKATESSNLTVTPGFHDLVQRARKLKLKVALATSSRSPKVAVILKKLDLENFFDVEINGDSVLNNKPSPDVYFQAVEKLELIPADCITIEDSSTGILSAKAAGVKCIAFNTELTKHQDKDAADVVVNSLSEVTDELLLKI